MTDEELDRVIEHWLALAAVAPEARNQAPEAQRIENELACADRDAARQAVARRWLVRHEQRKAAGGVAAGRLEDEIKLLGELLWRFETVADLVRSARKSGAGGWEWRRAVERGLENPDELAVEYLDELTPALGQWLMARMSSIMEGHHDGRGECVLPALRRMARGLGRELARLPELWRPAIRDTLGAAASQSYQCTYAMENVGIVEQIVLQYLGESMTEEEALEAVADAEAARPDFERIVELAGQQPAGMQAAMESMVGQLALVRCLERLSEPAASQALAAMVGCGSERFRASVAASAQAPAMEPAKREILHSILAQI